MDIPPPTRHAPFMYSPHYITPAHNFFRRSALSAVALAKEGLALGLSLALAATAAAQNTTPYSNTTPPDLTAGNTTPPVPSLTIDASQIAAHVSPILYGFMTEEINYSYDGGLYAELLRNRTFQDNATDPVHWSLVQDTGANGTINLDTSAPLNDQLPVSLRLDIASANSTARVGFANDGFWGIPIHPDTTYRASFYAKAAGNFTGPLTLALVGTDSTTYATATIPALTGNWAQYNATLTTGNLTPTKDATFQISANSPGTTWFDLVSLFPPTYNNRPNGNRVDIMELLASYHPAFLRFPGGNYLEGNTIAQRFNWKKTIGDLSQRPGHPNDAWRYRSSDGMGLLEFLEWCEDLKMQPLLAVYGGFSLHGERVAPGPDLDPYVQDALDEIEYVTGNTSTKWGAERAKDGHPEPFQLNYVEVGNEDYFDRAGVNTYDGRFTQFYNAIKKAYPNLQIIASDGQARNSNVNTAVKSVKPDVLDSHIYTNSVGQSETASNEFNRVSRDGPKIFKGEWATRVGAPTPNLSGALGDAAYMTGLERNSDLVIMASYAPLFVNVSNPRRGADSSMQWPTDLIGYDALSSYASPSFYAQQMFNNYRGDVVLPITAENIPTAAWTPPAGRARAGQPPPPPPPPPPLPTLYYSATRDTKTGTLYLKFVNTAGTPQPLHVDIKGLVTVSPDGQTITLSSASPTDTNSLDNPTKIVPVVLQDNTMGMNFLRTLPPYSLTILQIQGT